ncbi:hypothetical protein VTI74DRAFT_1781 [Chaetomium olivicolor]
MPGILTLDHLPLEILSAIRDYLGCSHPPSVLSFGLANKRCYSIASAFLYQSIAFKVESPGQVAKDARRCRYLLHRDFAFQHVRRFIVYGKPEAFVDHEGHSHTEDYHSNYQPSTWERMPCSKVIKWPDDDDDEVTVHEFVLTSGSPFGHCDTTSTQAYQSNSSWRPLCVLVELLPALTDLVFICYRNQLPPCLLETLHNRSSPPRLKLRLYYFNLRSLAEPEIDPHEMALASSPLLHHITVPYAETNGYDRQNRPNYHSDAVMDLVRGLAPNLRGVFVTRAEGGGTDAHGNYLPPPPPWKGFPNGISRRGERRQQNRGSLRYLEIYDWGGLRDAIQRWETCTDFAVLQTLKFSQRMTRDALVFLVERCSFPNLTSLHLSTDDTTSREGVELLRRFFCSLPNLRVLAFSWSGPFQELGSIPFSQYLTRLWLSNKRAIPCDKELPLIIRRCPQIEHLSVTLSRSQGRASEASLYRLIGSLPRLRRLELRLAVASENLGLRGLDASPDVASLQSHTEANDLDTDAIFGANQASRLAIPKRALYNTLIDAAVDGRLAMAIFKAVSNGKKKSTNIAPLPLEFLSVHPVLSKPARCSVGETLIRRMLEQYIGHIARSWRVNRDPRDDCPDMLRVVELPQDARWRFAAAIPEPGALESVILPIIRRIWPEKTKGSKWYEDWESLPLEQLGDEE